MIFTTGSSVITITFGAVIAISATLIVCVGIICLAAYKIAKCISNCNMRIHGPNQLVVHC